MQERSITTMPCGFVRDLTSAVKLFGLRVTLTPSEKFSIFFAFFFVRKNVIISLRVFSLFQRTSRFNGMRFLAFLYVDDCHWRLGENLPAERKWSNYSVFFQTFCSPGRYLEYLFHLFQSCNSRLIERIFRIILSFPFVVKSSFKSPFSE